MLRRENRLARVDFPRVKARGALTSGRFFSLLVLKKDFGSPRFGIVVSNKISKKAVERNAVRRKLRQVINENISHIDRADVVVLTRKNILNESVDSIGEDMKSTLKRAGLLE